MRAVEDVTASVHRGEIMSVIGPNGAGKTSLLNMISGFYRPTSGSIVLGGLVPPLEVTPSNREGGGWVQIFQVKGNGFVKETDWFHGYRDLVLKTVNAAA